MNLYHSLIKQKRLVSFLLTILFITISFHSCTPRKKLLYIQDLASSESNREQFNLQNYILRTGDMLHIKVQTMDDKTFRLFNSEWQTSGSKTELSLFIDSYVIDSEGYIQMPVTGKAMLGGLSLSEAEKLIRESIDGFLTDANVSIRLVNYKITILGEVNRPGTFRVLDNQINLFEALSLAGDLTVFGNRQNIKVLRKTENNHLAVLDITKTDVVNSKYFYLMPHDIVYIEPLKAKSMGFREFPFSIMFSSVTTIIVLINFLTK